jgi:mono/diheme cytochrome c family protein
MSRVLLLLMVFLSTPSSFADNVQIGREIYHDHCASCHGREMQKPGLAFDLKKFPKDDFSRFLNSVLNGKGAGMPPWKSKLNQDDIECLWDYVRFGADN